MSLCSVLIFDCISVCPKFIFNRLLQMSINKDVGQVMRLRCIWKCLYVGFKICRRRIILLVKEIGKMKY